MEQVVKDGVTTYSQVANQLIQVLKLNSSSLGYFDDDLDEDRDGSDSNSDEKPSQQNNELITKREKNIKRRVYDALNVQLAAGVLVKQGKKYIKPNYECKEF